MDDFQQALAEEFDLAPPEPAEETPATPEEPGSEAEEVEEEPAAEGQVPPEGEEEKPAEGEPAKPSEEEEEEAKPVTKGDILAAIREDREESATRIDRVHEVSQKVIEQLHPEGIDTNIYDSNGNVIKTAQDIVDKGLINRDTGEPFTYEQAASWMLQAQQQMAKNVEELNHYAEDIAEKNVSLFESNARVMRDHGDLLKAMPNLAQELAQKYVDTQVEWDKTGNYITKMNMSPETFYKLTLAPYRQYADAIAEKQALESQLKSKEETAEQEERMGIPQRGSSKAKSATGDAMLDALIDELDKE